jgi:hypothetical protein
MPVRHTTHDEVPSRLRPCSVYDGDIYARDEKPKYLGTWWQGLCECGWRTPVFRLTTHAADRLHEHVKDTS